MSVEKFEHIIHKIHEHTKLVCLHVKGEPLLHNKLQKILEILEKYNLKFGQSLYFKRENCDEMTVFHLV